MLRLFNDLKIKYLVISLIGASAICIGFTYYTEMYFLGLILSFVWCCYWSVIFNKTANKRLQKLNDLRMNECRIQEFTDGIEKLYQKKHPHQLDSFLKTTLSTGYHDLGLPEKTIELLSEPMYFPNTVNGIVSQICCYNNMASSYLQLYDAQNAETYLEKMKGMLNHPAIPVNVRPPYEHLYWDKLQLLRMVRGDYSEAQEYFTTYLQRNQFPLGQVVGNFYLAKAYIHNGCLEKARECIQYVIENGGDSFYAKQAKEFRLEEE